MEHGPTAIYTHNIILLINKQFCYYSTVYLKSTIVKTERKLSEFWKVVEAGGDEITGKCRKLNDRELCDFLSWYFFSK